MPQTNSCSVSKFLRGNTVCNFWRSTGSFVCDIERVKRFGYVHLRFIASNLKRISKMLILIPPGKISADARGSKKIYHPRHPEIHYHFLTFFWVLASGPHPVTSGPPSAKLCSPWLKPLVTPLSMHMGCGTMVVNPTTFQGSPR